MSTHGGDLKRQLGTIWRTARVGIDTMRDVVVRSSQTGRFRIDIALLHNERAQLLQQIGELTLAELDEGTDRSDEKRALCDRVRDVEGRIRSDSARATDNAYGAPRGFEPEASADYGDDTVIEDAPSEPVRRTAPVTAPKSRKRKSSAR